MPRQSRSTVPAEGTIASRLNLLAREAGSLSLLATRAGISPSAMSRCLNGGNPSIDTAKAICAAAGASIDWLVNGSGSRPATDDVSSANIPFYHAEASAGPGLMPLDNEEWQAVTIPVGILSLSGSSQIANLCAIQAKGDSMDPTIRNGSLLVVNRSDQQLREGIYVVTRDEALLVKRTQPRENKILRLKSDNPQYEYEDIDLKDPTQSFQIFGRVIWTGHAI